MINRRSILSLFGMAGAVAGTGASAATTLGGIVASTNFDEVEPDTPFSSDDWMNRENHLGIKNYLMNEIEESIDALSRRVRLRSDYQLPPKYTSKRSWSEAYKWGQYQKDLDQIAALEKASRTNKAFAMKIIDQLGLGGIRETLE